MGYTQGQKISIGYFFFQTSLVQAKKDVNPQSSKGVQVASKRSSNPFTKEEEAWLEKQFDQMDSAFCPVNLGPDLMQEMVMFSFGVPLSKSFLASYLNTFCDRIRAIGRTQNYDPESMTDGFFIGLALLMCKVESCQGPMLQKLIFPLLMTTSITYRF